MTDWEQCFAHSLPNKDCSQWQTLQAHADGVQALCMKFAKSFGSQEAAALIGAVHDAGKSHPAFQTYLCKHGPRHPHAADGAKWLDAHVPTLGRLLAYTVDGHHAGLPDGVGDHTSLTHHLRDAQEPQGVKKAPPKEMRDLLPDFIKNGDRKEVPRKLWLWIKMLFSCLVDADWLDTEGFMDAKHAATRPEEFDDFPTLLDRYHAYMATLGHDGAINKLRDDILHAVLAKAQNAPGLYTLTVPTGGGKTLASLGFALEHAIAHRKHKIIYAIPYSTIIEQTADTLSRVLNKQDSDRNNVLEHHAEAKWREKEDKIAIPLRQLTENWADVPVVVTTNVQFFESFYAAQSSRCRKLHNVANSVIILDEAQKLPEKFLAPCAELLHRLVSDYGCTVVLCTATQPNLSAFTNQPDLSAFFSTATELAPDVDGLYAALRRVDYHLLGRMEWDKLADRIAQETGALCVVNTRQDARDLYAALAACKPGDTFHLSTWMCPAHRRDVITQIRERLKAHNPTYVVSTSLIEAGVDLDFPTVFRAFAGLDSLAQAAGRCNREGKLKNPDGTSAHGQVYIFEEPKPCTMGIIKKAQQATRRLGDVTTALHKPESFPRYFAFYYYDMNDLGKDIVRDLQQAYYPEFSIPFRTVSDKFHLISEEADVTLFVPYGEAKKTLKEACTQGLTRERIRKLRGVRLQVRRQTVEQLGPAVPLKIFDLTSGETIEPKKEEGLYYALLDLEGAYSADTGLNKDFDTLSVNDSIHV